MRIRQRQRQKTQLRRGYLARHCTDAVSPDAYWELVGALTDEIAQMERRLIEAEAALPSELPIPGDELREALELVLTPNPPENDWLREKRAALVGACVSQVRIEDVGPAHVRISLVSPSDTQ